MAVCIEDLLKEKEINSDKNGENTRISAGTEKHSMGGGVWEQTNLGGVKL